MSKGPSTARLASIAPTSSFGHDYLAAFFIEQNAIVFGLGNEVAPHIVRHELIHFSHRACGKERSKKPT